MVATPSSRALFAAALVALFAAPASADYLYRKPMAITGGSIAVAPANPGTRLFVTASTYTGNLGGLAGADAKCMADANKPNDGRTYVAVLSTSTVNANTRFTPTYPVRDAKDPTRVIAASGFWGQQTGLSTWAASPTTATASWAFTGSYNDGTVLPNWHCNNWSDGTASYNGEAGMPSSTVQTIMVGGGNCTYARTLYCVSTTP